MAAPSKNQKFDIILFAGGFGNDMFLYPMCEKQPKSLINVGNKPLIAYSLEYLEQHAFQKVFIVTNIAQSSEVKLKQYLEKDYKGNIQYEIINFPQNITEVEALISSELNSKIKNDFILLNCDTITNLNLYDVMDVHSLQDSYITMVLKEDQINLETEKIIKPSSSNAHDIFFINDNNLAGKMVNMEVASEDKSLTIKKQILTNLGSVQMYTNLFDTHIYICKNSVLHLIKYMYNLNVDAEQFKEDVLPFLMDGQFNKELLKELNSYIEENNRQVAFYLQEKILQSLQIRTYIVQDLFVKRINNLKDYLQINNEAPLQSGLFSSLQITENNGILQQLSVLSYQGEGTEIGNNCTFRKSIIGKNVKIGENCKIENSIIMNGAQINDGCTIQNSIICQKVEIQEKQKKIVSQIIEHKQNALIVEEIA